MPLTLNWFKKSLYVFAICMAFAAGAQSQETDELESPTPPIENPIPSYRNFFSSLPCEADAKKMFNVVQQQYGELPFASGQTLAQSAQNGQYFQAEMFMLVNPTTKTYSIIGVFADGTACMFVNGRMFTPYRKKSSL